MSQISSSIGLVSGINYGQLISEMMSLDSEPIQVLQTRIQSVNAQQSAYSDLQTQLTSLQSIVQLLAEPSTIQNSTANSSNTSALTATVAAGTTPGTYQFQVARLVSTQQMISSGFSDSSTSTVGAGTQTLTAGTGALTGNTQLYQLNGANGVGAGSFTITDASGNTATISTSGVSTLNTLITNINSNTSISVHASLSDNGIVLTDTSGGTGTLSVTNADSGDAADKLGLTTAGGATEAGKVITGGDINTIGDNTTIQSLNGGLGVQTTNGNDFQIATSEGTTFAVNLTTMNSVQNVLDAINNATGNNGAVTASVTRNGSSIQLTDKTGGTITVSALNGSTAAQGLGLLGGTQSGGVLTGQSILSPLNSVFISSLNGGSGLTMGAFTVTNKDGTNTVNLSGLTGTNSVQDIINTINNTTATTGISAQLNTSSNGIQINNVAGGSLTIADADSNDMATQLGITVAGTTATNVQGKNLGLATVSAGSISIEQGGAELNDSTPLTQLNGGAGVSLGNIRVTDAAGQSDIINLSSAVTIDDVAQAINSALDVNVTATVTDKGLVVTDNSTGSGTLSISNVGGDTTATSLGLTQNAAVGGTITGNSVYYLGASTALSQLNDGLGVRLSPDNDGNDFTLSLASGATVDVDLSGAKTMGDVINDINTAAAGKVTASINASTNALSLTDNTTGSNTFSVSDTETAQDLGLATAANGNTITGSAVMGGLDTVKLSSLNGGSGFSPGDINFTNSKGQTASLNFAGATNIQDIIYDINNATDSTGKSLDLSASLSGGALQITDNSAGSGNLTIADATGSTLASQLGIAGTFTTTATGTNTSPSITPGIVQFTNRNGQTASINFSGATTVQDVLNDINNATDSGGNSLDLSATLDPAGTGIQITDNSGGSGDLTIADTTGTLASQLGIAGTYDTSVANVTGTNLNRQFVNQNTLLTNYNFGQGVNLGTFRITNSLGDSATVNLATIAATSIGDVINAINSATDANGKSIGVTASLNAAGNGIQLTDSAGGTSAMTVADVTGTAAANLQIAGTATGTTINGALEKTIAVSPTDTLTTIASKINALGFGVNASVIDDGSDTDPYRLSLTASNSGYEGRFIFNAGTTQLGSTQLVAAQDAAVFVGSGTSTSQPLLVTSKQNQITGIIPGLTVNLVGASTSPVTVNVTNDDTQAVTQINSLVTGFNGIVDSIANYSTFNTTTDEGGVLLGDYNTQDIQTVLYDALNTAVGSTQQYHTLADLGFSFNDNGELQFDQDTFDQAYATNPGDVQKLLTATATGTSSTGTPTTTPVGIMAQLSTTLTNLLDPTDGLLAQEDNTLAAKNQNFQDQITQLNTTLANQQNLLEQQFANLETTLSSLQSQQQTISTFADSGSSSSSSSKS
jgi:flagellar hook-associated protein 2